MDGLCLHAGEVGQALGRASGRRGEQRIQAERLKHAQDAADRGSLAGARTAGQNDKTVPRRRRDGLLLLFRIRELAVIEQAVKQAVYVEIILVIALRHIAQHMCEISLRVVHIAQIDRVAACDLLADEDALVGEAQDAGEDAVLIEHDVLVAQQADDGGRQLVERNKGVAVPEVEGQRIDDACVRAVVGEHGQAELDRQTVRKTEIDVIIRVAQQVRVLLQAFDGAVVKPLVQQRRDLDGETMLAEEVHQLAHRTLLDILPRDLFGAARGDALDLGQPFRLVQHHIEGILAEFFGDACTKARPDAADQAGGQIIRDAADGSRQAAFKVFGRKLLAVGRMHDPAADHGQLLAQTDARKSAGRSDLRTLLRQKAQHGVTVFLIAENDLLDRAAQLYIFFFVHKAPSSPAFSIPDT